MLKNFSLLISFLFCIPPVMNAEKLSPEEAFLRVTKTSDNTRHIKKKHSFKLAETLMNGDIYVFDSPESQGYMLVGGDDCVAPLICYSENGKFCADSLPPQLHWLLEEYARQIEYGRYNKLVYSNRAYNTEVIAPLLNTNWDQGAPFNTLCPTDKNGICYTGCVATAMAQVMNYWKYPSIGKGTHSFALSSTQNLSIDFSEQEFAWDSMLNNYIEGDYTDEQANAVGWLMKACGYSVDMKYGSISSGALTALVPRAMRDYFNYASDISYVERMAYSASDWEDLIVNNLKNYGPVIYNGYTQLSGGHSFVCDGYDGNGFFHINWGWSGMSDGYFKLDILDPEIQGIGGSADGFNFRQNAIINIHTSSDSLSVQREPRLTQYGSLFATVTGVRTVTFGLENYSPLGWGNSNNDNINLSLGALLEPQGETEGENQYVESMSNGIILSPGAYYPYDNAFTPKVRVPVDLSEGTYRMSLVTLDNKSSSGVWSSLIVPYGYNDYVTLVKDQSGLSVINHSDPAIAISDATVVSESVYNKPITVRATIINESSYELTQSVSIVLISKSAFRRFVGEGINVTLMPGESITKDITSKLYIMGEEYNPETDVEFTLALHNPITNTYYGRYGIVNLQQNSGITNISDNETDVNVYIDKSTGYLRLSGVDDKANTCIYSTDGMLIDSFTGDSVSLSGINHGVYILKIENCNGLIVTRKCVL